MAEWIRTFATATGDPMQCWDLNGEELFAIVFIRLTGGDDEKMPRRVIGTGRTRADAQASADHALSRYDDRHRVVPAR